MINRCEKCGKDAGIVKTSVLNNYPIRGFSHDTKKVVCKECYKKFCKYMSKSYDKFFKKEGEKECGKQY